MSYTPTTASFPIIALGASAGGLYALEQFFDNMPTDSGMAFVVIQHLSPDFKSLMDDILGRRTTMAIKRVENAMQLEPDTIYLIPPKSQMTIDKGLLYLRDKLPHPIFELPIDIFLQSLAEDAAERAIAIILSGTGSDGSRGLQNIKRKGGLIIVQSPDTAQFDGMPRSALATGLVDYELPPHRMPALLVEYCQDPAKVRQQVKPVGDEAEDENAPEFAEIFATLRRSFNLDFAKYRSATVGRRIKRRMELRQFNSLADYTVMLTGDTKEQDLLYHDLLIGVTEFFRDPEVYKLLEEKIIPELFQRSLPGEDLRVWSAGCATGEEPYSLAILLHEKAAELGFTNRITIFATDVHRTSLDFASTGLYDQQRLGNLTPDRIERHFNRETSGLYRISPELRKLVVFAPHNLTNDPPFTKIDLTSCRNLLIYFLPEVQERAISLFHYALRIDGVLLLGSSEGLGAYTSEFETIDNHSKLFRKNRDLRLAVDFGSTRHLRAGTTNLPVVQPNNGKTTTINRQVLHDYDQLLQRFMPPGLLINEDRHILHYFGAVEPFLKPKHGRVEHDALEMIEDALHIAVSTSLQRASKQHERVQTQNIRVPRDENEVMLDLTVDPILDEKSRTYHYMISFDQVRQVDQPPRSITGDAVDFDAERQYRQYIQDIEFELQSNRETLQATIEELQTTNEELQATNEELLAANEELQSTNEELHSINEELYTVNAEFERKNTELRQLNFDHDNLLTNLETGIIFLDKSLRIRKYNQAVQTIFRLLPQDLGRPIDHISYSLTDQQELMSDLQAVLEGTGSIEREKQLPDGRWLLYRALPFCSEGKQIDGVVLSFTEVTRIKQAEQAVVRMNEELERKVEERTAELQDEIGQRTWAMQELQRAKEEADLANRTKSQFLATMSHEIRTPMNGVIGFLQLMETTQLDEAQKEYAQFMRISAENLLGIIGDILDISKIEAGTMQVEDYCFRCDDLLESVIRLARPLAQVKGLTFTSEFAPDLTHDLKGDPVKIKQVLINLLTNAIKFTASGTVALTATHLPMTDNSHWVRFSISDTGCGIPSEKLEEVFQPFVQADGSTTRRFGGTGLGLSICRSLTNLMGGRVTVTSVEGKGSCFTVDLPLACCDEHAHRLEPVVKLPRAWSGNLLSILVVDDHDLNRQLSCKLVESMGHQTFGVANGTEALERWKQGGIDLILMDLEMPEMDGATTTRLIREIEQQQGGHVPIVALTAHALAQEQERALSAGMDGYVTKPVMLGDLLLEMKRVLE
jgi:two-component system, chemotaxis family, CheB/CheR fusion protein